MPHPKPLLGGVTGRLSWSALTLPLICLALLLQGCSPAGETGQNSDFGARIVAADKEPQNWLSTGRTYSEQHFSPLDSITRDNVGKLGLAWYHQFDTHRGQEGTPLEIDGLLYVSTAWSKVYAFDARNGTPMWSYDPKVPGSFAFRACCDVVNRGLAAWGDKIYIGVLDGRLVALDAKTGKIAWSVQTTDPNSFLSITGAPRIVKGLVIIGNGGADFGERGYFTAYDAETGKQVWRFYTVPGDPSKPFESPALEAAAKTWTGEWWKQGGGGTVWDSMAYDPDADLLYIGVGNGYPWTRALRSPGGGDNLYLASIVALRPETGEYVWHYQTTPGESWDYTATQPIVLADLTIDGKPRKVLMQAPKNGFFYVLDRLTGELLAAKKYVETRWASHIDMKTGRPVENPLYRQNPVLNMPGFNGGHNWQPMAYSPKTGLVYVPIQELHYSSNEGSPTFGKMEALKADEKKDDAALPDDTKFPRSGALIAWDPVAMREVWRAKDEYPGNGGVLATAGGLVFEGTAAGKFAAYDARTGEQLWHYDAGNGILAAPISYAVDGLQYVAILIGYGGGPGVAHGFAIPVKRGLPGRLLVFRLDGQAQAEPYHWTPPVPLDLTGVDIPPTAKEGKQRYETFCIRCHGVQAIGGTLPDLRYSPVALDAASWKSIVLGGALSDGGMVSFARDLSEDDAESIRAYILTQAARMEAH